MLLILVISLTVQASGSLGKWAIGQRRHWQSSIAWWRHQMEIFLRVTGPLCGEITGPGEFPTQRPVTRSFDVFFDLRLNKRLSKQPWGWWFETPSWMLWRHYNVSTEHSITHTNHGARLQINFHVKIHVSKQVFSIMASDWLVAVLPANHMPGLKSLLTDTYMDIS